MIVNIIGGLGNQLFQYAMAIALSKAFPSKEVKINKLCFRGYPLHNGFELDKLIHIRLPYASTLELMKASYPWIHYRLWQIGKRILPRRRGMVCDDDFKGEFSMDWVKDKVYFDGYWQSPKFFGKYKKDIVEAFDFPELSDSQNIEIINLSKTTKLAFIHVRRGDYLNHPVYGGICTDNYYIRGIEFLRKNGYKHFIVFSNDIIWCKKNLSVHLTNCEVIFANWNKGSNSYKDMQLMSHCDAGIIANSSFSWWGAWLSEATMILCPDRWTNKRGHRNDIFSDEWIKIPTE